MSSQAHSPGTGGEAAASDSPTFSLPAPEPAAPQPPRALSDSQSLIRLRNTEEALQESEARARAIFDAAVDAVITIDERGTVESLNPAAERMFGYTAEELIGQNVKILMPRPYTDEHDGYLRNYLTTGEKKIIGIGREVFGRRKDGTTFPMDLAVSETRLRDRRLFTGIARDITELKNAIYRLQDSEARTRAILHAAVDAMITIDERGTVESLNPSAERLFGYRAAEIIGRNVKLLMPPPYADEHDTYLSNYVSTGQKKIIGIGREVVGRRKDGSTFPMDLAVSEVALRDRRVFTGIARDMTRLKNAIGRLQESETRTRAILEAALDCIVTIDSFGRIIEFNPAAEKTFRFTRQQVMGKPLADLLIPPGMRERHRQGLQRYLRTGEGRILGRRLELDALRADGSTFPVELAVVPIEFGGETKFTAFLRDITERRQVEEQLRLYAAQVQQQNTDLLRSNQELDDFAYVASHDLKEPLRGMHNYASFLMEDYADKLDEAGRTKLRTLKSLTLRMEALLDSLLEFSRVGRVDFAYRETDLNAVVADVLESLSITFEERGVGVRIPRPLPSVPCDPVRVTEVFRNLITNAVKYNDKSERWVEIGFRDPIEGDDREGEMSERQEVENGDVERGKVESGAMATKTRPLVFYIRDNGIGIREKHFQTVFRIFKRLHGRDSFGGGSGAGLTIVKKIVERHGGQIWIESVFGEGSIFSFTLTAGQTVRGEVADPNPVGRGQS